VNGEWQKHSSNCGCRISTLQTTATGPTVDAGHHPCNVEENKGARFQPYKVKEEIEVWV